MHPTQPPAIDTPDLQASDLPNPELNALGPDGHPLPGEPPEIQLTPEPAGIPESGEDHPPGEGPEEPKLTRFRTCYIDTMEMYADHATVAAYFDSHQGWFGNCAHPMKAEQIGATGYALTIGRFGAFGYEVEPKIGLDLIPGHEGLYRIATIPVPDYTPPGYDVDFQATMQLVGGPAEEVTVKDKRTGETQLIPEVTQVQWELNLLVTLQFPRFIHRLPASMIQKTGDNLLHQIVRQVSKRLTYKVQENFHQGLGLPIPRRK